MYCALYLSSSYDSRKISQEVITGAGALSTGAAVVSVVHGDANEDSIAGDGAGPLADERPWFQVRWRFTIVPLFTKYFEIYNISITQ